MLAYAVLLEGNDWHNASCKYLPNALRVLIRSLWAWLFGLWVCIRGGSICGKYRRYITDIGIVSTL